MKIIVVETNSTTVRDMVLEGCKDLENFECHAVDLKTFYETFYEHKTIDVLVIGITNEPGSVRVLDELMQFHRQYYEHATVVVTSLGAEIATLVRSYKARHFTHELIVEYLRAMHAELESWS